MLLFVPTDDPASEPEPLSALLVPYHPDYPCLRHLADAPSATLREEEPEFREVRHDLR